MFLTTALALGGAWLWGLQKEPNDKGNGRRFTSVERLRRERLRAVHEDRQRFAKARKPVVVTAGYQDLRAILHAHAEDSAHTGGTRPEMLAAARRAGVRVIMLSDHVRKGRDVIDDSWRGVRDGVLFIPGAEHEGFLAYPMQSLRQVQWSTRDEYVGAVRRNGGLIFLSHPEERMDWSTEPLDGMEIYNHHANVKEDREYTAWLRGALLNPDRLVEIKPLLDEYPLEVFAAPQDYPAPVVAKWDREAQTHRVTGVAANDCHHNQVFTLTVDEDHDAIKVTFIPDGTKGLRLPAGSSPVVAEWLKKFKPGDVVAKLDFDPYERSFAYVTTHILAPELTESAVREALRRGRAYVAHDWLCDPTGFVWGAETRGGKKTFHLMGEEMPLTSPSYLIAALPHTARIKLYRNGILTKEATTDRAEWPVTDPGVYRVEAWLSVGGEERPWIYSNPIYIR